MDVLSELSELRIGASCEDSARDVVRCVRRRGYDCVIWTLVRLSRKAISPLVGVAALRPPALSVRQKGC